MDDRDEYDAVLMCLVRQASDGKISGLSEAITAAVSEELRRDIKEAVDHNPLVGEPLSIDDLVAFIIESK